MENVSNIHPIKGKTLYLTAVKILVVYLYHGKWKVYNHDKSRINGEMLQLNAEGNFRA